LPAFPGPITARLQQGYWDLHQDPAYRDEVDYGDAA
jgi:branched-chain amino acid aminotransferase